MHVKTTLLNGIGDVGFDEGGIMQVTHQTMVLHGIVDKQTIHGRYLGTGINMSGAGLALTHTCTLLEVQIVLPLRHENAPQNFDE